MDTITLINNCHDNNNNVLVKMIIMINNNNNKCNKKIFLIQMQIMIVYVNENGRQ